MYSIHDTAKYIYQSRNSCHGIYVQHCHWACATSMRVYATATSFLCLGPGLWSRPHSSGGGRLLFSAMRSFHVGVGVGIWMDGWK